MKVNVNLLKFFVLALILGSCFDEEDIIEVEEGDNPVHTQLFSQIKAVDDALIEEAIWPGYTLADKPMYLIRKNEEDDTYEGYVVNPQSTIMGAVAIPDEESAGLNVVRYDTQAKEAFNLIMGSEGNGTYDFDFTIDENSVYYIQVYTDEEVTAGRRLATYPGGFFNPDMQVLGSIDFIVHEIFHIYQEDWASYGPSLIPSPNQQYYEYKSLVHQIFKDFPNGNLNTVQLEEKLKQYVAIRSAENVITGTDITSDGEKGEGTARYMEKIALRNAFSARANEPFIFGSVTDDDYGITNQEILLLVLENLQYETGSSAYLALKEFVPDIKTQIEEGKNQFEIAEAYFNMSQAELDQQLQNAKASVDFAKIQRKAAEWMNL
ncbi:hypothetical protein NBT05_14450 [Aquimarina sp. ERC-38]|uniref:hypothetical protein n=1 Tax=Aquimarina sp. ERC-38 TaxID=2949996 RepID=UPI00224784DE|nr:hypothetical protein [Aquimarina sp. ERC-38]UZO80143.1 hypothetical protein NBT05_14450 [Aquimarina sp. ERC-38]